MIIHAPWTQEQVDNLNAYQLNDKVHEYTAMDGTILIATTEGWRKTLEGPVVQTWCHDWSAQGIQPVPNGFAINDNFNQQEFDKSWKKN